MEIQGQRYLSPELNRFLNEESKMAFVAGPRQVGKTTLARRLLTEAGTDDLYFNWDIEAHRKLLIRHPGDFWQRSETSRGKNRPSES
jgi:predicted AAA+ superfamily ATPase